MIENAAGTQSTLRSAPARTPWQAPRLEELPRLTELTLATEGGGIPGDCDLGGSGSTCF